MTVWAGAAAFTDTSGHWASEYIDDITSSNLVAGYDDGTFKPDKAVTNAEALAFVSRLWKGDTATVTAVQKKWQSVLTANLPSAYSWLQDEAAICLEAGVLTQSEFTALCTSGALGNAAKREDLAVWLVKAMQLSSLAASYGSDALTFADKAAITASARPFVALLAGAKIIVGDDLGNFSPVSEVTRGAMAAMLSRSLDYMEDQGVIIELTEFTDYSWAAGVVTAVSGSKVTLKSGTATSAYTLPEGAAVRSDGLKADLSADLVGKFALVTLDGDKDPVSLAASTTKTVTGEVSEITESTLTLGDKTEYSIGRTVRVNAGGSVGDRSLIDTSAAYEEAQCLTDLSGRLLQLTLTGGESTEQGIFYAAYGDLFVTGLDGVTHRVAINKSTDYEVDGESSQLADVGGHYGAITFDEDGDAASVTVDTALEYVVAAYKSTVTQNSRLAMSVKDRITGEETTYEQTKAGTTVYIGSKKSDLGSLIPGYLVQIKLINGLASELTASTGALEFEGTVTGVKLGNPIIVDVDVAGEERSLIMVPGNLPGCDDGGRRVHLHRQVSGGGQHNGLVQVGGTQYNCHRRSQYRRLGRDGGAHRAWLGRLSALSHGK